ncbi:hypothetical protein WICPIJ_001068 [Wickerhamomyces pijperi]|uniref:Transcriptional protein SWT1 n=1 Tax=Wickerhamomyces pijperi TaxID=599730 RepID=A0A9P8QBM3_WICPI|nr:hypothetical protein WICPIJ_001068 [Wickerhamomyces pijperi]
MGELASKYSSLGLSKEDQKKVITTARPGGNKKRVVSYKLTVRVNEAQQSDLNNSSTSSSTSISNSRDRYDVDGDIPMIGMDDEEDVEMVTEFVTKTREDETEWSRIDSTKATEMLNNLARDTSSPSSSVNEPSDMSHLVLDTNFMISHLDIVDSLSKLHLTYNHKIIIPSTVIKELDGLKGSNKISTEDGNFEGKTIGLLARWANDWIYRQLASSNPSVRAQKLYECVDRSTQKDDSILDCCLYFKLKEKVSTVVLLSNDKNLCMKALGNEILTVSYRKDMSAELISETICKQNQETNLSSSNTTRPVTPLPQNHTSETYNPSLDDEIMSEYHHVNHQNNDTSMMDEDIDIEIEQDPAPAPQKPSHLVTVETLPQAVKLITPEITKVVIGAIEHCMCEEYGEDLDLIMGYDPSKIINLHGASEVLIQYYVSVFTEYFKKSAYQFRPFDQVKGRKLPKYTEIFENDEVLDVVKFVKYWCEVLRCLYFKRDKRQNEALEKCIERWIGVLRPFV